MYPSKRQQNKQKRYVDKIKEEKFPNGWKCSYDKYPGSASWTCFRRRGRTVAGSKWTRKLSNVSVTRPCQMLHTTWQNEYNQFYFLFFYTFLFFFFFLIRKTKVPSPLRSIAVWHQTGASFRGISVGKYLFCATKKSKRRIHRHKLLSYPTADLEFQHTCCKSLANCGLTTVR